MDPNWALALLAIHAGATCAMAGLVWFVQVVHYPLFAAVPPIVFDQYEALHTRLTTRVVAPLMLAELVTAVGVFATPVGRSRPGLAACGVGLLAVVWASTFALQVPRHRELAQGFDASAHRRLVTSNWLRTAAWSGRSAIALLLLGLA